MIDLLNSVSFWTSVIIILALIYQWWRKPHPNFPPLIRGYPGLGVIPYFDIYPQKIIKKWSLEMQEPVIAVRIGNKDIVVLNTYEVAHEVRTPLRLHFSIMRKRWWRYPLDKSASAYRS